MNYICMVPTQCVYLNFCGILRAASSRLITTRSIMGFLTLQEKPRLLHMCATTPSSIKVVPCDSWRPSLRDPIPKIQYLLQITRRIREMFSSMTSGRQGLTVFTTCVSWTIIPSLTGTSHHRSVFRWQRRRRIIIIWIPVSRKSVNYPPLSCLWRDSSDWRWRLNLNSYPAASRQNRSNPTFKSMDMSRLGGTSHGSVSHTATSGAPRCWRTRSVYSDCSVRVRTDYTYSAKKSQENTI